MGVHYDKLLTEITEIVTMNINEGAPPEDVIAALETIKFTLQFQSNKAAEAFNILGLRQQNDNPDLTR